MSFKFPFYESNLQYVYNLHSYLPFYRNPNTRRYESAPETKLCLPCSRFFYPKGVTEFHYPTHTHCPLITAVGVASVDGLGLAMFVSRICVVATVGRLEINLSAWTKCATARGSPLNDKRSARDLGVYYGVPGPRMTG